MQSLLLKITIIILMKFQFILLIIKILHFFIIIISIKIYFILINLKSNPTNCSSISTFITSNTPSQQSSNELSEKLIEFFVSMKFSCEHSIIAFKILTMILTQLQFILLIIQILHFFHLYYFKINHSNLLIY
jgi:disulfide bond formation protein DsbB